MRATSDRLCREYGLSVIEHPHPGMSKQYGEWRAEQEGRPTYRSIVREDVDEAITQARTEKQFFHYLKEKGYSIKFGIETVYLSPERARTCTIGRPSRPPWVPSSDRKPLLATWRILPGNCRTAGIPVYSTALEGGEDIRTVPLKTDRALVIMGSERDGVSPALLDESVRRIYIPSAAEGTSDRAESLNVAIATAITCYEIRLRRIPTI